MKTKFKKQLETKVQPAIQVWKFHEAPEHLQKLSEHGGDEDWLALIPPHLKDDYLGWMDTGTQFGCCHVSEHRLEDGSVVRIGAHS